MKKKDEKNMNKAIKNEQTQPQSRKERIKSSYNKAVKANGKALDKLSKN